MIGQFVSRIYGPEAKARFNLLKAVNVKRKSKPRI
jgi:hypothetical protein